MKIVNKNYNLKSNINTNIVLISDIHYHSKEDIKHLNKILKNIINIKPNYICIPGDLTDEANIEDKKNLINWLTKLSNICPVIISLGNHEFYIKKREKKFGLNIKLINKIKKIKNIYFLDNSNILIDNINFIGLTLPVNYYYNNSLVSDFFNNIKSNNKYYNVLLCHSPMYICDNEVLKHINVDLILCGHMHGGVTPRILRPLFKNRGLVSPKLKLFPKNCYGKLKLNNTDVIITSGITVISNMNKFKKFKNFFASEIVKIKIDN